MTNTSHGRRLGLCTAIALCAAMLPAQRLNQRSPIGTNLSELRYFTSQWVFRNAFDQAAPWWSQEVSSSQWSTGSWLDRDGDGWVKSLQWNQAAGTLMYRGLDGHYPGGRYVVTYDGDGDLQVGFDAREVWRSPGRIEMDVTPSDNGIYLKLVRTNPGDYLRNIRVFEKQYEFLTSDFHPAFTFMMQPYGVIRFMDFLRTNNSPVRDWSERTKPTHYTQDAPHGVAYEVIIDLCNETGAEPWICVPHEATDDYVRNLATLFRDRLSPGLRVWVEYSNEVWNGGFTQAGYAQQQGQWRGLSANPVEAGLRFYADRSVEIFNQFTPIIGASRMVRVLAGQNANPWLGQQILDWRQAYRSADVLAVAPYFGIDLGNPSTVGTVLGMTVPAVLVACYYDIAKSTTNATANASIARARGLELVAYEGGQHLVGFGGAQTNQALTNLFTTANRHPWMYPLTSYALDQWRQAGGQMFCYYTAIGTYSMWGSWGALEYHDQDWATAPKFLGIIDYIIRNPKWW